MAIEDEPPPERTGLPRDLYAAKRDKLLDILRRLLANPGNAREVADEIALDWFPLVRVNADGSSEFVLGSGRKK